MNAQQFNKRITLSTLYALEAWTSAYWNEYPRHVPSWWNELFRQNVIQVAWANIESEHQKHFKVFKKSTYTSLPAAAKIPVESSYSIHRTELWQRPTVATQVSLRTSHIFTVTSWDAVRTRSPESIRTELTCINANCAWICLVRVGYGGIDL
jgi:hypothetical protein